MQKDLLCVDELTTKDLNDILKLASDLKLNRETSSLKPLAGKTVAMIFSKSSTRTRVSFEVGIRELGGSVIYLDQSSTQLGRGETVADTAQVMSRYLHAIVIRTYKHSDIVELAKHANIPVINALTDAYHPCQVLTDLFTIYEYSESFEGIKLAYLGDGACNMPNSLILAAKLAGIHLTIGAPEEFKPSQEIMDSDFGTGTVTWETDPKEACKDADYIYTDVWVSMGCEKEKENRLKVLAPYQVTNELLDCAAPNVKVLHCLPAHRGEEISAEVIDGPKSIVFDQAENRLHVQKAIMSLMFDKK